MIGAGAATRRARSGCREIGPQSAGGRALAKKTSVFRSETSLFLAPLRVLAEPRSLLLLQKQKNGTSCGPPYQRQHDQGVVWAHGGGSWTARARVAPTALVSHTHAPRSLPPRPFPADLAHHCLHHRGLRLDCLQHGPRLLCVGRPLPLARARAAGTLPAAPPLTSSRTLTTLTHAPAPAPPSSPPPPSLLPPPHPQSPTLTW